ncbi:hypothetical protein GCM10017044_01740 [Kordiimonas sediminis]|uniref:Tll0287-like domain-containing protein n=1 Tax=Kordiimonas sediminis TaxID=1735581 RepID=A0A919AK99_9PROT|nr:DUF3365 domain-containing protein [Kordiimonas sediminis]GHF11598.1 hypothetical protein GCM10017044_01740 [Kordiimonas sediminis]
MKSIILIAAIILTPAAFASEENQTALTNEARELAMNFGKTLKAQLLTAFDEGGIMAAVSVCNAQAPQIAQDFKKSTGWTVGRTSLKPRNTANAPSQWQVEMLQMFEQQKLDGMPLKELEWSETAGGTFRYMKAIPTGALCTACHGTDIEPELQTHITSMYPDDKATGFQTGDIRGAFVLTREVIDE